MTRRDATPAVAAHLMAAERCELAAEPLGGRHGAILRSYAGTLRKRAADMADGRAVPPFGKPVGGGGEA